MLLDCVLWPLIAGMILRFVGSASSAGRRVGTRNEDSIKVR